MPAIQVLFLPDSRTASLEAFSPLPGVNYVGGRVPNCRRALTTPLLRRDSTQPRLLWLIPAVAAGRRTEPAPLAVGHCW